MKLEVCAFNVQSCIVAWQGGASRIELCSDHTVGGTTPSYGLIEYVLRELTIPVFPMIRPRGGGFVYDKHEVAIMKNDIMICRQLGCPGIATGVLTASGNIDIPLLSAIVEWAYPMEVTCHKAFDKTPDAYASLEGVISAGCSRVLTSGLEKNAVEGMSVLAGLVAKAAGRIIIMPGGGVRASNIGTLVSGTGAIEYHSSAIAARGSSDMADVGEVMSLVNALK